MPLLPFPSRGLYAVTGEIEDLPTLRSQITQVLAGGAQIVQLRDKHHRVDINGAKCLLDLCHQFGVPFLVNDNIELAYEIEADGVHLGRNDADLEEAIVRLGKDAIVGVSCYGDLQRAREAEARGATYVAFGSFFPSKSKPHATPAPISILPKARKVLRCPIVAIGGITPDNGRELIEAGADLLAVIGGLFAMDDPLKASTRYQRLFSKHPTAVTV